LHFFFLTILGIAIKGKLVPKSALIPLVMISKYLSSEYRTMFPILASSNTLNAAKFAQLNSITV